MLDSFDDFCSLWPGADTGGTMRGMHAPISLMLLMYKAYNFFHNFEPV